MNGLRRVCYVVVLSIFLLALAAVRSDGSRKILGTLLGDGVHWDPPDLDPDKVWFDWRKAIEDVTYDIQDLHSTSYSKGNINSDAQCTEMNEEKATQLKKLFPNCLGSKKFSLCISWKCLLRLSSPSRRHLISKLNQRKEGSSPYPLLKPQSKAEGSSPSKDSKNRKVKSPPSKAKNGSNSSGDSLKDFIIFVVAASVAIISILAMLLCCCLRGGNSKVGPRGSVKDDKPLLFCTSNISGSSQTSHGLEQLSNKEFKSSSVLNGPLNHNVSSLSQPCLSTVSTGSACEATPILLPLPPGRTAPPAFVQPPPFAASSTPPSPPPPSPPPPPPPPPSPPPPQMRPKAPAAPPPPPPKAPGPRAPPPPPNAVHPPPAPLAKPPSHHRGSSSLGSADELSEDSHKAKLKPFFWDKVSANPDQAMVWHELKAGSFQVNEEMMESLFGYTPASKNRKDREGSSSFDGLPKIQIIDAKKSQNLSILLRALNVTTEEVCDALREGTMLPPELVHTLIKMAPTSEEELKLRLFNGDLSQLGVAERFLKFLVEIPFAFKRLECLLFMSSLQEEVSGVKEAFKTLEVASTELRNSRLFLKLLEAVLKTGNRMNDGTYRGGAQAFKLDTLLKLSDVKGLDGKTTLLHFVIQEIIRSEGVRAARTLRQSQSISSVKTEDLSAESPNESAEYYRSLGLQVVSGLSGTLENVKKAAHIDGDNLSSTCARLGSSLFKIKVFLNNDMKTVEEESEFRNALEGFVEQKEGEIGWVIEEEKRIMALVKKTADYFHGDAGKDEGLRLFVIVRDFLIILDKSCNDVKKLASSVPMKPTKKEASSAPACSESPQKEMSDIRQRLFPAIKDRRMSDSSSDDSSSDDDS